MEFFPVRQFNNSAERKIWKLKYRSKRNDIIRSNKFQLCQKILTPLHFTLITIKLMVARNLRCASKSESQLDGIRYKNIFGW